MIGIHRDCLRNIYHKRRFVEESYSVGLFNQYFALLKPFSCYAFPPLSLLMQCFAVSSNGDRSRVRLDPIHMFAHSQMDSNGKLASNLSLGGGFVLGSFFHLFSTKAQSRSLRRRIRKREKHNGKPVLDEAQFQRAVSQLLPRFTPGELHNVIVLQENPVVCLELFNWAAQQRRFKHDISTYHITIQKLGAAKLYAEMDDVVNQVLAIHHFGTEALYNTIIYYFTEARKLSRAVNIFKHMRKIKHLGCRASITTYNILFKALLSRGTNSYINHVYMETIRCLFKQMVDDGIEPDIFILNSMIKGYVLSLHVNDALRIFHQMGVVYHCLPNSFSYDYLIHGLCVQGRTNNARELCVEMKKKGFIPSSKSYNSLVNALALSGDVEEAVNYLWEMIENQRLADLITHRTILEEICRQGRFAEAMRLLNDWREKNIVDQHAYKKLLNVLDDDAEISTYRNLSSCETRGVTDIDLPEEPIGVYLNSDWLLLICSSRVGSVQTLLLGDHVFMSYNMQEITIGKRKKATIDC